MGIVETLTAKLRVLMAEHQIRAAPLARRAQLNESAVRDILRGRSKNPGIVTLQKIASVMNLRPSALFEAGEPWQVRGEIHADGQISPAADEQDYLESPFFISLHETLYAYKVVGASMAPLAYDGDYLVVGEHSETIDGDLLGRPALCDAPEIGEIVCIPQLGSEPEHFHLSAVNAFGAAHRNVPLRRAAPVVMALPAALAIHRPRATHPGSTSVHEDVDDYSPK